MTRPTPTSAVELYALVLLLIALPACNSAPEGGAPGRPRPALAASLQKTYDTTCKTCHEDPAAGAPRTGDAKAWASVVTQAKGVVIDHVVNGYKKMPPMGMCMHCTEADFVALTEHMAAAELR